MTNVDTLLAEVLSGFLGLTEQSSPHPEPSPCDSPHNTCFSWLHLFCLIQTYYMSTPNLYKSVTLVTHGMLASRQNVDLNRPFIKTHRDGGVAGWYSTCLAWGTLGSICSSVKEEKNTKAKPSQVSIGGWWLSDRWVQMSVSLSEVKFCRVVLSWTGLFFAQCFNTEAGTGRPRGEQNEGLFLGLQLPPL